jgi:L-arabinonolactonase
MGQPRLAANEEGRMAHAKVDCVLDIRAALGECPIWCERQQALFWVDINAGLLNRFDPSTGINTSWRFDEPIGSFALCQDDRFVVALKSGLHRFEPKSAALTPLAKPEADKPGNRLNDGRCDYTGRLWVGSMADPPDPARPSGTLYRFDAEQRCTPMVSGLVVSNGLAFSPDGRILYHSDSHVSVRTIWAWDLDPDGNISNRRVFVDTHGMPGRPDGGAIDADGCYWMAANDGWEVVRFTPAGAIDRRIPVPVAKPSMLTFGGPKFDTLYIASIRPEGIDLSNQPQAGSLFAVAPGVTGLPEPRYRG